MPDDDVLVNIDFDGIERWIDDPDTDDTGGPAEDAPYVDMGAYEYIAEDYYFDITAGEDKTATVVFDGDGNGEITVLLWDAELISPYANQDDYPNTTFEWIVEYGPAVGAIQFSDTLSDTSSEQNPSVTLNLDGFEHVFDTVDYVGFVLKFTANDQIESDSDLVRITVYKDGFTQQRPQVTLDGPYVVNMADLPLMITGTISDDGEPVGGLTAGWQLASAFGVGGADFSPRIHWAMDEHHAASGEIFMDISSDVTFTQPGRYRIKLTAIDGELSGEAFTTVEVVRDNNPPTVEAGSSVSTIPDTYPYILNLKDTSIFTTLPSVVDEGLLKQVEISWRVINGPINGMFYDPADPLSKLTFSKTGEYILQLVADDGQYTVTDQTGKF